ncbi:MAG: iron ABC transporter permease [Pseudomonadota bacterium]|nr:iron ABC transporter permease [Pseudomonadota bacterium]
MVSASSFIEKIRLGDRVSTWSVVTLLAGLLLVGPFVALFVTATGDSGGLWSHLMQTVFPRYVVNTLALMAGVAIISLGFGVTSAWIVARFRFPGDRLLEWMLLLPATVPAYIIAYTYTDLLEYAGPVQGILRDAFGWRSAQDYWFPEIRSIGGAMLVMASVLYPYIYLLARTAFRLTPASYFEVARLHNRNFTLTADLALARPAIVAGLALVLMEVISDFGTVDYFAVETLTLGIFNVWLGMNSLTAAAQIAGIAFIFIIGLLYIERTARSRQRFTDTTQRSRALEPAKTTRVGGIFCTVACLAPIILGFGIPVGVLLNFIFQGLAVSDPDALSRSAINSVLVSLVAAICVVVLATVTALTVSYKKHPFLKILTTVSATGYAFPGTVLAIGVVSFSGAFDGLFAAAAQNVFGLSFDGFLIGGVALLILAYVTRFQAIGYGALTSGVDRLSPNIMNASFVLGRGFSSSMLTLAPRLLHSSMMAAGLLVFVDVMKELPMTLLLRPFNFDTLSTYVYQFAKDELLEEAALAALAIVAVGLGPVILMNASQKQRTGNPNTA